MPYPNEHAARLRDPKKYTAFRRENDAFGSGIHAIWGIIEKPKRRVELQAIRFSKSKFTAAEARTWLKAHDYKPIEFEAASDKALDAAGSVVYRAKQYICEQVKVLDRKERILLALVSTDSKDRDGDIVRPRGGNFKEYLQNPVVLWVHDSRGLPVAKVLELQVLDHAVYAKVQFADTDFARDVFELYAGGFLNSWSIGFTMDKYVRLQAPPAEEPPAAAPAATPFSYAETGQSAAPEVRTRGERFGWDILEWTLLELSAVPIGANQDANTVRAMGELVHSKALRSVLDLQEPPPAPAPEAIPEERFRKVWVCADCGAEQDGGPACGKCGGPVVLEGRERDGRLGLGLDKAAVKLEGGACVAPGAFTKTVTERGTAKIPLHVSCGAAPEVTLDLQVLRTEKDAAGHEVITEARIDAVSLSLPDGIQLAQADPPEAVPPPVAPVPAAPPPTVAPVADPEFDALAERAAALLR